VSTALLFALALTNPAQDADVLVNYKTVAVPLSRALEEISKASGAKLKAAQLTEKETVVISVKGMPLSQVKARLATAVVGVWTKLDDGTEQLGADLTARLALSRAASQKRIQELDEALKGLRESLVVKNAAKPKTNTEDEDFDFVNSSAATRLIAQMTIGFRAVDLAGIPQGDRIVYSTQANSMQRQLNAQGLQKVMAEFIAEHNVQADAMKNGMSEIDPAMAEQMQKAKEMFGGLVADPKRIEAAPTKLLLVVERGGMFGFMGDSIEFNMIAFDSKGQVLASSTHPMGGSARMGMAVEASTTAVGPDTPVKNPPQEQKPEDPRLKKNIELSPIAMELKSMTSFMNPGQSEKKPSAELLEHVMRPDLYDPLSFEYSESLIALEEALGNNLVACVPDSRMDFGMMGGAGRSETLATFNVRIENDDDIFVERKDGWATIRQVDPEASRAIKVDRKGFAAFLANVKSTVVPSLDALANYAATSPPLMETPVVMPHVMLVAPNAMSIGMRGLQDWKMLRLYGLLGPGERTALRQGLPLAFSSCNAKSQVILKQMVFGAGAKLQIGPDKENVFGMFGGMAMGGNLGLSSYREEPTELLPSGLPAGGLLKLDIKPSHFVLSSDLKGGMSAMFGAMGPEEYAMLKYFTEEPKMAQLTGMMPKLDKFKVGDRDILDFRLILAEDVSQKHTLIDQRIGKDALVVGAKGLPKDFLAEVDKQLKLYKDGLSPFLSMPGMMGGSGIPPR